MKQVSKRVGIILPAYNEGKVISRTLSELKGSLTVKKQKYNLLVIVVNDGSSDNTAIEVRKHKNIHLIDHIINLGAGAATRTGLAYAKRLDCDYVVTMDSDGQHHIADVKNVIREVGRDKVDFVIGSRLLNSKGMPWYRVLGNKALNIITFILFGVFVSDSQSGLKALNRKALDVIEYRSNNFAFCSEMIWQAKRRKLIIKEIPVRAIYTPYSLSKGQSNLDVIYILKHLLRQRFMGLIDG